MEFEELFEKRRASIKARFDARHTVEQNGCWLWTASKERLGYGVFYAAEKKIPAHRASWMLHRSPIPAGKIICHTCDIPACVNPDHLFVGDYFDNNADRSAKLRSHRPQGRASKLDAARAQSIRTDSRSCAVVAKEFGIHPGTVSKIRRGQLWKGARPAAQPNVRQSVVRGGFIVARRRSKAGDLVGYLRPTEHANELSAIKAAEILSAVSGCEAVIFQQICSVKPEVF